jgi:hypothetical protein
MCGLSLNNDPANISSGYTSKVTRLAPSGIALNFVGFIV